MLLKSIITILIVAEALLLGFAFSPRAHTDTAQKVAFAEYLKNRTPETERLWRQKADRIALRDATIVALATINPFFIFYLARCDRKKDRESP